MCVCVCVLLQWVFVDGHRFSLVVSREYSSCRAWMSHCSGFLVVKRGLWSAGSVFVAHGISCPTTCGTFLDHESNSCALHCQVDS